MKDTSVEHHPACDGEVCACAAWVIFHIPDRIAEAVAAEREECARIAETAQLETDNANRSRPSTYLASTDGDGIAQRIRLRGEK